MAKRKKIGCSCQKSSIGKMKRRRRSRIRGLNTKDIQGILVNDLLPITGGFIVGSYMDKVPFIKDNPQYANYASLAAGLVLAASTKGMAQKAGIGLSAAGAVGVVQDLLNGSDSVQRRISLPAPGSGFPTKLVPAMIRPNGVQNALKAL